MSKKNNLVSIIVPIYNVKDYLSECIESIINQTYKNIEIILVDDGSTDGSSQICDKYKEIDDRIIVIHQENKGLVLTRKAGMNVASGEYIGFVDGDDYIENNMYEELLKYMLEERADIIHSAYIRNEYKSEKKIIGYDKCIINTKLEHENFLDAVLLCNTKIPPSICFKLFKKELFKKCYSDVNNESSYGEDLICLISAIMNNCKILVIEEAFYHYRKRENSITQQYNNAIKREYILCENVKRILIKHDWFKKKESAYYIFVKKHMMCGVENDSINPFKIQKYIFPEPEIIQNKKVIIYGAGSVGRSYYSQISRYKTSDIVAWVDKKPEKYNYEYIKVENINILLNKKFDIIIIAVLNKNIVKEIYNELISKNVEKNKIIWLPPELNEINT